MEMDKPLEKIIVRQLGPEGGQGRAAEGPTSRSTQEKSGQVQAALRSGDPKKLVAAVEEVISEDPAEQLTRWLIYKLTALIKLDEQEKALDYSRQLAKSDLGKSAQGLNGLAWTIVDPDAGIKPSQKLIEFAVETARRADELAGGKDAEIADTLAKAFFDNHEVAKAVETQERAFA